MSDIKEQLTAVKEELAAAEEKKLIAFAEFGELALPELKNNPAFAGSAANLENILADIKTLSDRETELIAEQAKAEREEKEQLIKRTCFLCKTVNPDDAKFCESCGGKLGELPREYCEACCTVNPPGLKFCGECGAKLKEQQ